MNFSASVITGTEATAFWEVRPMIGFRARNCYQLFLVLSAIVHKVTTNDLRIQRIRKLFKQAFDFSYPT